MVYNRIPLVHNRWGLSNLANSRVIICFASQLVSAEITPVWWNLSDKMCERFKGIFIRTSFFIYKSSITNTYSVILNNKVKYFWHCLKNIEKINFYNHIAQYYIISTKSIHKKEERQALQSFVSRHDAFTDKWRKNRLLRTRCNQGVFRSDSALPHDTQDRCGHAAAH